MSVGTALASQPTPAGSAGGGGWLFGRATDLLVGAGLGYVLSIPLLVWMTGTYGLNAWPTTVFLLLALFISGPHYGATILRVYEHRNDRRRYATFALWATLIICGLFVGGLNNVLLGSCLVTLYATWSPWHFSGQNYGVAVMFLRRRGVVVDPLAKRLLYASFVLAFVLSFLVMHGQSSILSNASVPIGSLSNFQFLSIGISREIVGWLLPIVASAYGFVLVAAAVLLLRHARLRDLAPASLLVLAQALWFAIPAAAPALTGLRLEGLAFTIVWISAAHALQYLWVSFFYARGVDPSIKLRSFLGRTLMAGSAVTILPGLIFAPGLLGTVPWDNGLALLVFSVVNLHHFVLDGAIWKLRDGKVAQFLLRQASQEDSVPAGAEAKSWFGPSMAVLGSLSLCIALMDGWEREININQSDGNIENRIAVSKRLAWIGRGSPSLHTQIARQLAMSNRPTESIEHFERSIALFPNAAAWAGLGNLHAKHQRWADAGDAYAEAVLLKPDNAALHARAGVAYLSAHRLDLARKELERASEIAPHSAQIQRDLARVIAAQFRGI